MNPWAIPFLVASSGILVAGLVVQVRDWCRGES
jgi:hypothetical protein